MFRLQVLLGMTFVIIYYNGLQFWTFSSRRNIPCSDDATLENAIKMCWKPQLSNRKFLKSGEVKLPPRRKRSGMEVSEPGRCTSSVSLSVLSSPQPPLPLV